MRAWTDFEVRGQMPDGHWPVRKCVECGLGLFAKPDASGQAVLTGIDAAEWAAMEAA